jgi:large subunit ribosomal protein L20
VLKAAKGYRGGRHRLYRTAVVTQMRAMRFAYRDRRRRKRDFRRLWITRISAAARMNGLSYSQFMHGLKEAQVDLDRKALAELAFADPSAFETLATQVKQTLGA